MTARTVEMTRDHGPTDDAARFWERLYRSRHPAVAHRVNPLLAETASALVPGAALDLGCGPGGDTIWLARNGWYVTAVDISDTATRRVADAAHRLGVGDFVTAERHDLARSFPVGRFDLVSAQYFHTPFDLPRARILKSAAEALYPGGRLLVVDHGSTAPWSWNQDPDAHYPTPHEVAADVGLDPDRWSIERADMPRRSATGPGGRTAEVVDNVLVVRRIAD